MKVLKIFGILVIGGLLFSGFGRNIVFAESENGLSGLRVIVQNLSSKVSEITLKLDTAIKSIDDLKYNTSSQKIAELEEKLTESNKKVSELQGNLKESQTQLDFISKAMGLDKDSVDYYVNVELKKDIEENLNAWDPNISGCFDGHGGPGCYEIQTTQHISLYIGHQFIKITEYYTQEQLEKIIQDVYDKNKTKWTGLTKIKGVNVHVEHYLDATTLLEFQYDFNK